MGTSFLNVLDSCHPSGAALKILTCRSVFPNPLFKWLVLGLKMDGKTMSCQLNMPLECFFLCNFQKRLRT